MPTINDALNALSAVEMALDDAKESIRTVREFLESLHALTVGQQPASKTPTEDNVPSETPAPPLDTYPDRITMIMKETGRKMRPVEIRDEYERRWPASTSTQRLGNLIRTYLWQGKNNGRFVHDEGNGTYGLPQ